ncbi:MAG: 3-phosphoshikimate 1-carboxyvinyltransferase [Opitutaceae bacterium]
MALPDILPIRPFSGPAAGEVALPGSKSITNRALMLAALGEGRTNLTGALFSDDTRIMAAALRQLGFLVEADETGKTIAVEGRGGDIPSAEADLFVGLAGTAARFLTALCAAAPHGRFRLDGTPQMRKRPMRGLLEALRSLGAEIRCEAEDGCFPYVVHAQGLRSGAVTLDASESSQMLSALLMVAPLAGRGLPSGSPGGLRIALSKPVREPFVDMTTRLMKRFGVEVASAGGTHVVPRRPYRLADRAGASSPIPAYAIEADASAAGYFLALPLAVGGGLKLLGVEPPSADPANPPLQGDIRFEQVLRSFGLETAAEAGGLRARSLPRAVAASGAEGGRLSPMRSFDFRAHSDMFLTLAALAPLLGGSIRITGIAHTRKQETDRVAAAAAELRKIVGLGGCRTSEDSLEIGPVTETELRRRLPEPVDIDSHGDHRVAMSFAILGCRDLRGDGRPWIRVRDPGVCAKSFPDFFERLDSVRTRNPAQNP